MTIPTVIKESKKNGKEMEQIVLLKSSEEIQSAR